MKTTLTVGVIASLFFAACAGPAARHDARVDRRYDRYDRAEYRGANAANRVETRQDIRYDRRSDRRDRVDARYGY